MLYLVHFGQISHKTKQFFFQKNQLQILKTDVFGKKTQGIWKKKSSLSASKLNEPVVTNYTRYHERVKKACAKPFAYFVFQTCYFT